MAAFHLHWLIPAALGVATLPTLAQAPSPRPRPNPLDALASVPAPAYVSAFERYRRPGDDGPIAWREANDIAARIGGWRVYAREAQQSDLAPTDKPAAGAPAAAPTKPAPSGHGGHQQR